MKIENMDYNDDAVLLKGLIAYDESEDDRQPGIIVFPDALGLGEHAIERTKRLSDLGYVALAADLYGDGIQARDLPHAQALMNQLKNDPARHRARARAAMAALAAHPRVDTSRLGAIGFCFGGMTALELVRDGASLGAVVSFHGGLSTGSPAVRGSCHTRILSCTGAEDPLIPIAQVGEFIAEMSQAGVDCQVIVYSGVKHSFTNPATDGIPGMGYSVLADRRAWCAMQQLFGEAFSRPSEAGSLPPSQ